MQYDKRYTHCHLCISSVDLNGSPLNPSNTHYWSNITAFTPRISPTSSMPCPWPFKPLGNWAAALQVIGPPGERQTAPQPMGERQMRTKRQPRPSWRGKNWSFGAWKSHSIYLYVDLSLSMMLVSLLLLLSAIEVYWVYLVGSCAEVLSVDEISDEVDPLELNPGSPSQDLLGGRLHSS